MGFLARLIYTTALAVATAAGNAIADERLEGLVRDAVVTYCDATRRGGCAGSISLDIRRAGKAETIGVEVPLGTPIAQGGAHVLLHTLKGHTALVTVMDVRGRLTARAIDVSPSAGGH